MFASSAIDALRKGYDGAKNMWRDYSPNGRRVAALRAATDDTLSALARSSTARFEGTVLIDAMWDNPNYWLRLSLLRSALGTAHGREVGLLGEFRTAHCRDTLERLGIGTIKRFPGIAVDRARVDRIVAELLARTKRAADILDWELPGGVPAIVVYDGILKRQRLASVDVGHERFGEHVAEAVIAIERARTLLDEQRYDLLVLTHPFNFYWGALAHLALARGIPVVLAFGLFGVLRFAHMRQPEDMFRFYDRPTRAEIDGLAPATAEAMASIGKAYLASRFGGKADDLASVYAYQRRAAGIDRDSLCRRFGWDPGKPIVAFYASNWFDWPHQLGMTQFRDFLDWTEATLSAACDNSDVNWLMKPHPCEEWFGGVALSKVLGGMRTSPHVGIADSSWNNTAVMHAIDALVTYHGTAGVEFASLGKPVLVPDRGKYEDCGFVKLAQSRAHYLELLATRWWDGMDLADAQRRAEVFAGWWFCAPDWQQEFLLADDSRQDALYESIPTLLARNRDPLGTEIDTLRRWWESGHPYYHTWKMMAARAFRLTNVAPPAANAGTLESTAR
jgi:hypothetical protein